MKSNKASKIWIVLFLVFTCGILGTVAFQVYRIDPFFHYHKPLTEEYFYSLDNERSQNDGILKHFDYDAVVTGTSMTQNFKTSEVDELFDVNAVKVTSAGGTFNEINNSVETALDNNPNAKTVIRGVDFSKIIEDKDLVRTDLGTYPTYLYDDNPFNDMEYLFNRNVVFDRIYPMLEQEEPAGITSFDEYSNWMDKKEFGSHVFSKKELEVGEAGNPAQLTEEEREMVLENVRQNLTLAAKENPDVTFYYFFTPYSAVWWNNVHKDGTLDKRIEAEKLAIEEMLEYDNIKLFSFNTMEEITGDLNNYKDLTHYGNWINSLILRDMEAGEHQLTKGNYQDYLAEEHDLYTNFDYASLAGQADYANDAYAGFLMYESENHPEGQVLDYGQLAEGQYESAVLSDDGVVTATGVLDRKPGSKTPVWKYMFEKSYVGVKLELDLSGSKYLAFDGQKLKAEGEPSVYVYDGQGNKLAGFSIKYKELDKEPHRYYVDISSVDGPAWVIFNGGYVDTSGSPESQYSFRNITLY